MAGIIWSLHKTLQSEPDPTSFSKVGNISSPRDNADNVLENDIITLVLFVTISAKNLQVIQQQIADL